MSLSTEIVLSGIMVIMAVLGGVVSAHAPEKRGHKWAYGIGFIVLGVLAVVYTSKLSNEAATAATKLGAALNNLEKAGEETKRLQAINNAQSSQIIELSNKTIELAKSGINTSTGGDSFCTMEFMFQFGAPTVVFLHKGKYPLYDVVARIVDITKSRRDTLAGKPMDMSTDRYVPVGGMSNELARVMPNVVIPFTDDQNQGFNIFFNARNGIWTEEIRFKKVNGNWAHAIRVMGFGIKKRKGKKPSDTIYEEITKDYSREEDGSIKWNEPPIPRKGN